MHWITVIILSFGLSFAHAHERPNSLDLDKLSALIQGAEKQVRQQIHQEIGNPTRVLVLGVTGSGKSTLVHGLAGKKLFSNDDFKLDVKDGLLPGFIIGHGLDAATTIPNSYYDKKTNLVYWDCPGFMDSRGQGQEIVNAFAIDQIFLEPSRIKILFVIQDAEFKNERGWPVIKRLEKIISLLPDKKQLRQGLSLVVTQKYDHRFSFQKQLRGLLESAKEARDLKDGEEVIDLLNFLTASSDQLFTFPSPTTEGNYDLFSDKERLIASLQKNAVVNPKHEMSFDANVFWYIKEMVHNFANVPELIFEFENKIHQEYRGKDLPILREWKSFVENLLAKLFQIKTPLQLVDELKISLPPAFRENKDSQSLMDEILICQRYLDFAQKIDRDRLLSMELSDVSKLIGPFLKDAQSELHSLIESKEFLIQQEQERLKLAQKLEEEVKAGKIAREEADKQIKELEIKAQQEKERAAIELKKLEIQLHENQTKNREELEKALKGQQEKYSKEMEDLKEQIKKAERERREAEKSASSSSSDAHMAALLRLFQGMSMSGGGMTPYSIGGMEYPTPFGSSMGGSQMSPGRFGSPISSVGGSTGRFDHSAIAAAYNRGGVTQRQVAQQFGCSQATVSRAVNRK
jgi:hypothetical protein